MGTAKPGNIGRFGTGMLGKNRESNENQTKHQQVLPEPGEMVQVVEK